MEIDVIRYVWQLTFIARAREKSNGVANNSNFSSVNFRKKMRVLLINGNRFKQPWPVIPFGLSCVAAACETAGYNVRILDLCFSKKCASEIKKKIIEFSPEVIGISIRNIDNSAGYNTLFLLEEPRAEIITPCKQYFSGPIVIGGPSVGINAPEMLDFFDLNYAIRGDGENAFVEFLKRSAEGRPFEGVGGLVIRKGRQIVQNSPPMRIKNLDDLPFVNPGKYIDLKPYQKFDSPLQIQTKRGCALSCTYCTYNRIEGTAYRLKAPELIANHIEQLHRETGINHLEFTDSTFNIPLKHCKDVLKALVSKKLNLNLRTMGLNPGAVDEELVELMKTAGFRDVDLGAESASDATLSGLGKHYKKKDVIHAAKLLQEKRIPTTWYLLVGAPGETKETLTETLQTINKTASKWDLINVGVGLRIYNGSQIADQMIKAAPKCTSNNFLKPLHYEPEGISLSEIKEIVKWESLNHSNYFMYDEDENTPPLILAMGVFLMRIFAPKEPIWRLHIIIRTIQKYTGITWLRKKIYCFRKKLKYQHINKETPKAV